MIYDFDIDITNVSLIISTLRNKLILREKYWLKMIFLSKRKNICWTFRIESKRLNRNFLSNLFFPTVKFLFIFIWMNDNNSLCYFKTLFSKQKNNTRKIALKFSIFAIWLKRRMKKSTICLIKLYIIMFCDFKTRWNRNDIDWLINWR